MIKKIASLLAGNLVFVGSQWIILVILTKFVGLTAAGIYALSLAIVSPIYSFTNLGLRSVAATDVMGENDFGDFVTLAAFGNLVAIFASITFAEVAFSDEAVDLVVLTALIASKTIESFCFIIYGFFQKRAHIADVSRSLTARGLLGLFTVSILLVITESYQFALYGLAFAWLFVLWRLDYQAIKRLEPLSARDKKWVHRWRDVRSLFLTSFPLGVLASFSVLSQQIPRYFVAGHLSIETLGIYAGIAHLALMGVTLVNAIVQTIVGRLAVLYRNDWNQYLSLLLKAIAAALVVGVLGILVAKLFGSYMLVYIYSSSFSGYEDIFVLAMVWSAILYVSNLIGSGLTGMRLFKEQSYIGGISVTVVLISSFVLVGSQGMKGAFLSLILGAITKLILQLTVTLYKHKQSSRHIKSAT